MKTFTKGTRRSATYAKNRIKLLVVSERIDCSPQMMNAIRNDFIHTLKKYLVIDESKVTIQISQEPLRLYATVPLRKLKER